MIVKKKILFFNPNQQQQQIGSFFSRAFVYQVKQVIFKDSFLSYRRERKKSIRIIRGGDQISFLLWRNREREREKKSDGSEIYRATHSSLSPFLYNMYIINTRKNRSTQLLRLTQHQTTGSIGLFRFVFYFVCTHVF